MTIHAVITPDRRISAILPAEIPTGPVEIEIRWPKIDSKRPRTSLADWALANAESLGPEVTSEDPSTFTGRNY